jgi:hypothetical protein
MTSPTPAGGGAERDGRILVQVALDFVDLPRALAVAHEAVATTAERS